MRAPTLLLTGLGIGLAAVAMAAGPLAGISHRDKLYDVACHNDHVVVVGYPGLILHSADRGKNFTAQESGTDDALFAIALVDGGRGIIVGRSGLVLTTEDKGQHWVRQDSGVEEHLFDVAMTKSGKAWAVGHFGTLIHSGDWGKTWKAQQFDTRLPEGGPEGTTGISSAEAENEGAVEEARLNAVAFADDQTGWIVGEFGLVLRTEDGGQTWKRQLSASGKLLFAIHVLDSRRALVAGSEGTFMETLDGGASWTAHPTGVSQHLLGLWPTGESVTLVGRDGVILVRQHEKAPFVRRPAGLFTWLNAVVFVNADIGFAVGGRGHLLMTKNAGESWKRLAGG
jgi:photosystem II stability/assembly factor-like uncharacterized protein